MVETIESILTEMKSRGLMVDLRWMKPPKGENSLWFASWEPNIIGPMGDNICRLMRCESGGDETPLLALQAVRLKAIQWMKEQIVSLKKEAVDRESALATLMECLQQDEDQNQFSSTVVPPTPAVKTKLAVVAGKE